MMVFRPTREFVARYPSFPDGEGNSKPCPRLKDRTTSVNGLSAIQQRLVSVTGSAAIEFRAKPSTSVFLPRALSIKSRIPAKTAGFREASNGESKAAKVPRHCCSSAEMRQAVLSEPPEPIAKTGERPPFLTFVDSSAMSTPCAHWYVVSSCCNSNL